MVRSANEAVRASLAQKTNVPSTCQLVTRTWLGAPSVGDVDGDGRADAVDGWLSEPEWARHTDRNPPPGAPIAWAGGSKGDGHRALAITRATSRKEAGIRTIDGDGPGRVATRPLSWVEQTWGLRYLGWTETISGQPIPGLVVKEPVKPPKPPHKKLTSRGWMVERAINLLETSFRRSKHKAYREDLLVAIKAAKNIRRIK